ncbi:MAG: hypothetical protein A3F72_03855 [Bacteroidetes bacterium RIFCSPLOWO2_12_FULL_35_15]|nr:MAG: hypothetical protein A3F72_03855 [Bacteroidetes bacterium RIFCSPLOWO2_12_FULL_35_15]
MKPKTEDKQQLLRIFPTEDWKEFKLEYKSRFRYAISNFGRVISYTDKFENGRLLKCATVDGYKAFYYKLLVGKKTVNRHLYIRNIVAENFLPKPSKDQIHVLLLDRNRSNNCSNNLKWATKEEMYEHIKKSPMVIEAKKKLVEHNMQRKYKLNSSTVKIIKRKIMSVNRKTRMKLIARQYGISEMQLYRIKSGENWGHVTVD